MWTHRNEIERLYAAAELAAWLPDNEIDTYRFRRIMGATVEQAYLYLQELVELGLVILRPGEDEPLYRLIPGESSRAYRGLLDLPPAEEGRRVVRPYWKYVPENFVDAGERSDG